MPDPTPADPVAAALAAIREREQAATRGPWEAEDDEDCWRLFGAVSGFLHPMQLAKAPKHGTPYAEYWPNEADAAFIVAARSDVPRLLAAVEAVLKVTDPLENETLGGMFMAALHLQVRAAISRALLSEQDSAADEVEPPRAETDCVCKVGGGEDCPCEADGPDGLCACCRTGGHDGSCASPGGEASDGDRS